jgi:subtilisin family serine protease
VVVVTVIALVIASLFASVVLAQGVSVERVRVIIGLKDYRDAVRLMQVCIDCEKLSEIPEIRAVVVEMPKHLVDKLKSLPFVAYVEEDKEVRAFQEVQWNVEMINATDVWTTYSTTYGDAAYGYHVTVRVAVLDTGIDYKHKDLQGAVSYCVVSLNNGKIFYRGTDLSKCADQNGHGTHVAGIIAARLNGFGVAGVAPKAVLYAVKVLSTSGSGYVSDVAKGIIEATKGPDGIAGTYDDADVISMSLGGPDSQTLYNAVKYAYSYGVVLVAAAGNDGASSPSCPACYSEVIAVGAIDQSYNVPSWSNRNPDVVAPGVNILSTYPGNKYAYMSGTSMACPHVSATVALIEALRLAAGLRKLTPDEVMNVLRSTAIDLASQGYDELYGYGLVDSYAALQKALSI